jgi:phospholipase/carboxylesterase
MKRIDATLAPVVGPHVAQPMATKGCASGGLFTSEARVWHAALFTPLHYEANYAYPLLIWLHGPGENESQLRRLMPLLSLRNYVALGLRGTMRDANAARPDSYTWSQQPAHVSQAAERLAAGLALAHAKFNIHPQRVYLAGFATGGTMAFRLALLHPDRFAGVLSLCGEFPRGQGALRQFHAARRLAVFVGCGRYSMAYGDAMAAEDLRLLFAAGMEVELRQYPCRQELCPAMLSDMDRWIMARVTGEAAAAPAATRRLA